MDNKQKKKKVVVQLVDKHSVAITLFNRTPYFHIRNNYSGKSVSLPMADMQSLVDNYPSMKKKLKRLREERAEEQEEE